MPSAGRKGVVFMKQHFSYLCVQLLPHSISCREPPPTFLHWQWRGSPVAGSLWLALFCFPFVVREVEKHPTTKRQAQQSKPACYTNREQVTAASCSQLCMVTCVTLTLEMQLLIPALQPGTGTSAGFRGVCTIS